MKVGYIVTEPEEGEKKLGVGAWLVDEIGGEPPEYDEITTQVGLQNRLEGLRKHSDGMKRTY